MQELLLKPLECNNSISMLVLWFSIYLVFIGTEIAPVAEWLRPLTMKNELGIEELFQSFF